VTPIGIFESATEAATMVYRTAYGAEHICLRGNSRPNRKPSPRAGWPPTTSLMTGSKVRHVSPAGAVVNEAPVAFPRVRP
jgi:hypothetical protein